MIIIIPTDSAYKSGFKSKRWPVINNSNRHFFWSEGQCSVFLALSHRRFDGYVFTPIKKSIGTCND